MKKLQIYLLAALLSLPYFSRAQQKFTLADFVKNYTFYPQSVYGLRSMDDGIYYTTINYKNQTIDKFSYQSGKKVATIVNFGDLNIGKITDYTFSDDESLILFTTNKERIYRRSFYANFYIYNLISKKLNKLTSEGHERLATISPDGKKVAFVKDNNLFIKKLSDGKINQITADGEKNKIINGAPDWVYEEEFEYNQAFEWSPDSKSIAYCRFDESKVKEYGMDIYAGEAPHYKENEVYPGRETWKYPKAGEANSILSVFVYHLSSGKKTKMDVGTETDQYIPRIHWTRNSNQLAIFRLNRLQNYFEILLSDAETGKSSILYTDKNKYYIDESIFDQIKFIGNGKQFVVLSEKDGWAHLYLYDMSGKEVRKLTKGDFDVTAFLAFNPKKKTFFYQAAAVSPMEREIYSVNTKGQTKKLSKQKGTNTASFSSKGQYFINYFSNVSTPTIVSLYSSSGKKIRTLEDNAALNKKLKKYHYNTKEFIKIPNVEGTLLNAWVLKPANFDPTKKYPVFMTQYSGPNSQEVLNNWSMGWEYLLAQDSFIVVCVDPRGTGARGEAFRKQTYLQLGKYESDDQIAAARWMAKKTYVDAARIGIWGWSYGGFMTLLCLEKGNGIFRTGIAVAPVTNWRYYDNIYTERYMRTPQENHDGYYDNSPTSNVADLKGKLFLIHGLADDNVHFQNSAEFIAAAIQANIHFRVMIYPNRNHSIYGGNTRWYLYTEMYDFLVNQLKE